MIYIKPKQLQTNELKFLNNFLSLDFFEKIIKNPNYEYSLIQEPYTGFGYADLVCVIWDKSIKDNWNDRRNQLKTDDIKILHHLYNCKVYKEVSDIAKELGFSQKKINKSMETLYEANLVIISKQNKIKIKHINDIFFVKEIIAIEAKLHDWKKALQQSINNTYFSSKSFTLFPEKVINNNLLDRYRLTDVGIISFEKEYKIIKKPQKKTIPSTLNSWFFNEYIGRQTCSVI